jgi:tetratricopeptide (TPR) repeat protein
MSQKYADRAESAKKVASVEFDASFMPEHIEPPVAPVQAAPATAPVPAAAPAEAAASMPAFQEFSIDVSAPSAAPPPAAQEAASSMGAHEIDLSDWEQMTQVEKQPAAPQADVAELAEEIQFYIAQSLWVEAEEAIGKLKAVAPGSSAIANLEEKLSTAKAQTAAAASVAAPEARVAEISLEPEAAPPASAPASAVAAKPMVVEPPRPAPVVSAPAPAMPAVAAAAAQPAPAAKKDVLADFALDLDESLGQDFALGGAAPPAPAAAAPAPAPVQARAAAAAPVVVKPAAPPVAPAPLAAHPDASSTLSDLFAEFKEDVEETVDEAEDPDTHYNLGVAFKEMGLLDEAIGELQKVCHSIDKGHPFSQVMQAYTWLAHCFLEKGVPEASVKWYEKALKVPAIDEESKLAVYYELGAAYEAAGNKKAALQNFNEVYSSNIDYRDVADRIKALRS